MIDSWRTTRRRGVGAAAVLGLLSCAFATPASAETFVYAYKGFTAAGAAQSYAGGYDDAVATHTQVLRGGAPVAHTAVGFDLQTGDVVQILNNATGALLAAATFEGAPALDATTCVGSASFAGTRTGNATVTGVVAFKRTRVTVPYSYDQESDLIRGSVATLNATSFGGTFSRPVPAGHVVRASQTLVLSPTASFDVSVERMAADCPPPPAAAPPPPTPPDTTLPSGRLTLPAFLRRSALIGKKGISLKVRISEPGTVRVDLYLDNGAKLPALTASAAATKKNKPKLTRIGGGRKVATKAGDVKVTVKTTTAGRKLVKARKRTKVRAVTTLTDTAGNRRRLAVKRTTIR